MFLASGMKLLWGGKTSGRSFISESKIFISEIKWSFFEIGQLSKSSEARFWQSRSRKRTIWSRKWKFCSKKGISLRVLLPKKQVNSRGTDIFSMFLTRDDPPHDLELSLGPRNHGNRGCPSIWSWWNILLLPNWTLQIVPNGAFGYPGVPIPEIMDPPVSKSSPENCRGEAPAIFP